MTFGCQSNVRIFLSLFCVVSSIWHVFPRRKQEFTACWTSSDPVPLQWKIHTQYHNSLIVSHQHNEILPYMSILYIAGITFKGQLQLVAFCLFEFAVGVFWPSMMKMRSQHVPEEMRATVINLFRIPLNLFVCVVLYNVSPLSLPCSSHQVPLLGCFVSWKMLFCKMHACLFLIIKAQTGWKNSKTGFVRAQHEPKTSTLYHREYRVDEFFCNRRWAHSHCRPCLVCAHFSCWCVWDVRGDLTLLLMGIKITS